MQPSSQPSSRPSGQPTSRPSRQPSGQPSAQPSSFPTVSPTYVAEDYQEIFDKRRVRSDSICENNCNGHGACGGAQLGRCNCNKGLNGEAEWTGYDCALRTCPK
jgi:hypothetical protein